MKEKLTLYIDKDVKESAKQSLKSTRFKSLSAFVEHQLKQLLAKTHRPKTMLFTKRWAGVISAKDKTRLQSLAEQDERFAEILKKHVKP